MPTLEELRNTRIEKLNELKKEGINPYPSKVKREISIKSAIDNFWLYRFARKEFYLAGRVKTIREHGKAAFFDIEDGAGKIQVFINPKNLLKKGYEKFLNYFDVGDFVEVRGKFFKTKKGEKTLRANKARIITKSIRPLPEKWHGLKDIEERYRKRYLDLLMNPEIKKKFLMRSEIIKELRNFLGNKKFSEFETPILQNIPGGATARPFITRLNALDMGLYLRIAPELYLKRLLAAGFNKVYEIGKNFRNEGLDATHNPEFTTIELYEAYRDAEYLRNFIAQILEALIKKLLGKTVFKFGEETIKFTKKIPTIKFWHVLERYALLPGAEKLNRDDLSLRAKQFGITPESWETKEKIADELFKKICRPKMIQPVYVVDYPVEMSPLAKNISGNSGIVDRFQLILGGVELVNGFSELNDPEEQKARLETQETLRKTENKEAHPMDEEFIEMLEYGMPPAAGLAVSIDRLAMLLTDTHNVKEVILFPTMKPR